MISRKLSSNTHMRIPASHQQDESDANDPRWMECPNQPPRLSHLPWIPTCSPMLVCSWLPHATTGASRTQSTGILYEDDSSTSQGQAQHNLTILLRLALKPFRKEKSAKTGIPGRCKRAGRI